MPPRPSWKRLAPRPTSSNVSLRSRPPRGYHHPVTAPRRAFVVSTHPRTFPRAESCLRARPGLASSLPRSPRHDHRQTAITCSRRRCVTAGTRPAMSRLSPRPSFPRTARSARSERTWLTFLTRLMPGLKAARPSHASAEWQVPGNRCRAKPPRLLPSAHPSHRGGARHAVIVGALTHVAVARLRLVARHGAPCHRAVPERQVLVYCPQSGRGAAR